MILGWAWSKMGMAIQFMRQVYCSCTCSTPGSSWKGPMKQGLSILLSCRLSGCFLGIGSLNFSEFQHSARNHYEVVCDSCIFWKNFFCPKNLGNGPKIGFFEFKEKFGHKFSLNLFYRGNLQYLLCSAQILYLRKILFLRHRPKYSQPIRLPNF